MYPRRPSLAAYLSLLLCTSAAADSLQRCDDDTAGRLAFIEERLSRRQTYADRWWKGWTGAYAAGMVVQSVRAGLEDDDGEQADLVVGAVKAAFGTARLLYSRPTAREGTRPLQAMAPVDPEHCRARLRSAEDLLRRNAEESTLRRSWVPHVVNVLINVAGGIIVAEGFDEDDGWTSAGIGIAVGEAMVLTQPWKADDDLAEYEARFGERAASGTKPSWQFSTWGRGARVVVRY